MKTVSYIFAFAVVTLLGISSQSFADSCGYKSDGNYHCGTDCGYKSDGNYHCVGEQFSEIYEGE